MTVNDMINAHHRLCTLQFQKYKCTVEIQTIAVFTPASIRATWGGGILNFITKNKNPKNDNKKSLACIVIWPQLLFRLLVLHVTRSCTWLEPCSLTSPSLSSPRQRQHHRLVHSLRHHYHHQGNSNTKATPTPCSTHFAIIIITKATPPALYLLWPQRYPVNTSGGSSQYQAT